MQLLVRHRTIYRYAASAGRVAMLLKLMPTDTPAQTVCEWEVSVNGEPVTGFQPNGQGELTATWIRHDQHDHAEIVAEGVVETRDTHGIIGPMCCAVDPRYFLRATSLTEPSDPIAAMARALPVGGTTLSRLHALSSAVSDSVAYRPGVTSSGTTAAQSFALGAGVCQDHAQIFIAAAHVLGIPARYVSGYLLAGEGDELHETHGWTEAWVPELGWVGFDPSNRMCVTQNYIRLASGLDADAAAPIRGSVMVAGDISIDADVRITPAKADMAERQLQKQQQQANPPAANLR